MFLGYFTLLFRRSLLIVALFFGLAAQAEASPDPVRVFVGDSESWEIRGYSFNSATARFFADPGWLYGEARLTSRSNLQGGSRPQTVEVINNFTRQCPEVTVTSNHALADFFVKFDRDGGKGVFGRDNKIVVMNRLGDVVFGTSTVTVGGAVRAACDALIEYHSTHPGHSREAALRQRESQAEVNKAATLDGLKIDQLDGFFWDQMPMELKTAFVLGYLSQPSPREAAVPEPETSPSVQLLAASQKEPNKFIHLSSKRSAQPSNCTASQILQGLDKFYRLPGQRKHSIVLAIEKVCPQ